MANQLRQKLSSYLSLFALLVNLLPPAPLAQANEEILSPAIQAHPEPIPVLISHQQPLTPVASRAEAVLPDWFRPPAVPPTDFSRAAGLSLAKPAAIAHLPEWPVPPPEPAALPVTEILPDWFRSDRSSTGASLPAWFTSPRADPEGDIRSPLPPAANATAAVLPAWFKLSPIPNQEFHPLSLPARVSHQPSAVILPAWFNSAAPPISGLPSPVIPTWFNSPPADSSAAALALPPLQPLLAPIPQVQVTVSAPSSVSAGNFLGDTYTITVRNGSPSTTAFNFFITATIPAAGFTYVPGSADWVSSATGSITYTDSYTHPRVVWTPNITHNLLPGEVVTLTFRMTTDGNATSGQRLDGNAVYQNPLGSPGSNNAGTNITVGRGNLIVSKSPTVQDGTFGDVITWTIEAGNTGLGTIFSTTLTDLFGSGYINTDASQLATPPFSLTVGERRQFVVTATVNSCNNLTNTILASWSIGNDQGDGTAANPVSDTTDIAYLLEEPDISLSSNSVSFDYCAQSPQTATITITNAAGAGPALNFRLTSAQLGSLPFTVGSVSPGWTYNGGGVFTTSTPILAGQTQTMTFVLTPTGAVCGSQPGGAFTFNSRFFDACGLNFVGPSTSITYSYNSGGSTPGLSLNKSAAVSGSNVIFALDFLAQNTESISGAIAITDVVPAGLLINSFSSAGLGSISQTAGSLFWTVTPPASGNLSGTLRITTTRSSDPNNCNTFTNVATATAGVTCPTCTTPLYATASVVAPANPLMADIALETNVLQFDYCLSGPQTAVVTVTNSGPGAAHDFALDLSQTFPSENLPAEQPYPESISDPPYGITATVGSPSSGWTFISSTQRFSYTAGGGVISPGQTITFSFVVTPADSICGNSGQWEAELEAAYKNVCSSPLTGPSVPLTATFVETDVPRFGLTKTSNANSPAQVGDVFDFTIDFTARNAQNLSDTIRITDVVPAVFAILAYTGAVTAITSTPPVALYSLTGTNVTPVGLVSSTIISSPAGVDTQLVWDIPLTDVVPSPFTLTGRLTISVQVLDLSTQCGAYSIYDNQATGQAGDRCPTCDPLSAGASTTVAIASPTGPPAAAGPKVATYDGQVCGLAAMTNTYSRVFVSDWNQATFTETLGADFGLPPGALSYITGSLSVIVDNTDVTGQIIIAQTSPQLVLDFDNITVPTGTHNLTITYNLAVSETILAGSPSINTQTRSQLEVNNVGSTGSCGSGDNFLFNTVAPLSLSRADLQIDLSLGSAATCAPVPVTLLVSDPTLVTNSLVAHNIVVTFSVPSSAQFDTLANISYGGGFLTNPVTITTGTNIITWTFQNPLTQTGTTTGSISFDLVGSCSPATLSAGVSFSDRCDVGHTDTAASNLAPSLPDVSLFVTPDQYTVNENKATWRIYATNGGDGTAGRVVITDVLGVGLQFVSYTTNFSGQVNLVTPGPFSPGDDVVWEILNLAPGQQVRIDVTAANVVACGGLTSDIFLNAGCLNDGNCASAAADSIQFLLPPFAVRSQNAQTADLPFCGTGEVVLTVKNSSATGHMYQVVISETITALSYIPGSARVTVTDKSGAVVSGLADIPFEPVTSTVGGGTLLTWRLTNPGINLTQTQILTDRAPEDSITIRFQVQTDCSTPGFNQVQSEAGGLQPCGTFFFRQESAVTLETLQPEITLSKVGRNVTRGDPTFAATVLGEPGDTVVWQVTANNASGAYFAQNVLVTDTLPVNMNGSTPTATATGGVVTPTAGSVTWDLGDLPADGVDRVLLITSTIDAEPAACQVTTLNEAMLVYGCDNGCTAQPLTATASLQSQPDITAQALNTAPLNTCGGLLTVTLTNNGPPAYDVFLTDTLPTGFVYQEFVTASTTPNISPTAGVTTAVFAWTGGITLPTGVSTLTFQVGNSGSSGACATPVSGPHNVAVSFDDNPACSATGPYTTTGNATINVIAPNLVVDKSPANQVADAGQAVTWTLTVRNTGAGAATLVQITDTVGSGFTTIIAGSGADADETNTPTTSGSVITWTPTITLASGETWTATLTATLAADGSGIPTNTVEAAGACASGCTYATATDQAFVTLLTDFDKGPSLQTGTIGSLAVFTFSTSLPDFDALYQNLIMTDTLPAGLGYVSSILTYTFDGDGGGTTLISTTPTISPALYQSGNVIWQLGDLPGTVLVSGVITTVIQNIVTNTTGVSRVNNLQMTYLDQGQPYLFTDTAQVDVVEPIVHLGKSYITPPGCAATLAISNFNDLSDAGWSELGTWSPSPEGYYQNTAAAADRRAFSGNTTWTDYSFSFMMRTGSTNGAMGGYVRQNNAGTTDTGYRFRWTNTQMELQTRTPNATLATSPGGYETGRWYHVEMRVIGSLIQVFVDGVLRLSASNSAFPLGRIGLLSDSQSQTQFDDILVTRMGQQGCFVGAGDQIAYTLTISNQGQLPGYDLLITDAIPAGMSLVTYSLQSDDPASALTAAPSPPVAGAANLVWNINQLDSTTPFNPLAHRALTITVVLSVSDGITANMVLSDQAALTYDSWAGSSSPTVISRTYSGGSHSAAVQTVDGGLSKTSTFSPPPTATLGSLVTYTLIVPASPITATLYNVLVTDQLNSPRFFIESVTTGGGTGATATFNQVGGLITATFASIPHDTQAFVTITTRISHEFPSPATDIPAGPGPDVVTNSAVMTHAAAAVLTASNIVTTSVGEPSLDIAKQAAITTDPQTALYTITITNSGTSPAYSLLITDNLPTGISVTTVSGGGQVSPDGRSIAWTVGFLDVPPPPDNTLTLTYTARLSQAIYGSNLFTNTAGITTTSLTDTIPGIRTYTDTAVNTLPWPLGRLGDYVWYDFDNDGVQSSHPNEFPISGVIIELFDSVGGNLIATTTTSISGFYIFENLPLNVTYTVRISQVSYGPGGPLAAYTQTLLNTTSPGLDSGAAITATFGGLGYAITTSLTPAFTEDLSLDYGFVQLVEIGNYVWFDVNNDGLQNDTPANGLGGVTVTVTYPDGRVFTTSTTPDGYYTFTVPISQVYTLTVTADNFSPGGPLETFSNTLLSAGSDDTLDSDGVPNGGGLTIVTPVISQNNYTFDFGLIIAVDAALTKGVTFSPLPTATLGTSVTYVLTVPNPAITRTLDNVLISDDLDARLQPLAVTTSGGLTPTINIAGQTVTVGFGRIDANTQALITITAIISDPLGAVAGDMITNTASLSHTSANGITTTNVVTTAVGEPSLNLDKSSSPPDGSSIQAGDTVTYAVTITNQPGPNAGIAYDLIFTDTLPAQMRSAPPTPVITLDSVPLTAPADFTSSYNPVSGVLRVTFATGVSLPVGSVLVITYAARVDDNLPVGTTLTNQAQSSWSSLPGDTPGDHDYPPISDTTTLTGGGTVTLTKQLNGSNNTHTISGTVPYSIMLDLPLGAINNLIVTDSLEAGLIYNNNPVFSGPAGLSLPPAQTVSTPNDGTAPVTVIWDFGNVANPPANPQPIVISFSATVANVAANIDGTPLDNDASAGWTDTAGPHTITDTLDTDDVITITIPALVVDKTVAPSQVAPGGLVTWTFVVRNAGSGTASGVDVRDTLPSVYFSYQPGSSLLNGSPEADPAIAGLDLFWDLNQTLPGFGAFTLTFQTIISSAIPTGVFSNLASAASGIDEENTPIPPDNSGHVPSDTDNDDADNATVLVALLNVSKSVDPATLSPNQVASYTIRVDNPGGTAITPTVTDTLPANFIYLPGSSIVGGGPDEPDVIIPPTLIWSTLPVLNPGQSLTITFQVTAATEVSGIYTNQVEVSGTDSSGDTVTDTHEVPVTLGTTPGIVVTKTRLTPSPVQQGDLVVYNLAIQNIGNATLFTVPLSDTYNPAHLQFSSAVPAPDSVAPAGTLTWNDLTTTFGDFAPGDLQTVVVTFTAQYVPGGATTLNSVRVTGIDTNTTTITDTDSATVTTLSPRLDFDKRVSPSGTISPGQRLDYTICFTNSGSLTATNIVITDFVPFNTTFISGSVIAPAPALVEYQDNGGAFGSTPPITTTGLRWTQAQLPPGSSTCVGFSVSVNLTISDTTSGLSVMASPLGWVVLAGDTSGLEVITYTNPATPAVTPTPTFTLTETPIPTATITSTPELTPTPEVTTTVTPTPAPTPPITATPASTQTPTVEAAPTLTPTETLEITPPETATPAPTDTITATGTPADQPITETAEPSPPPTGTSEISTPFPTDMPTAEPSATPAQITETPTLIPTDTPAAEPPATVEPTPTAQAVLPGWFLIAAGMLAAPALYGQPALQEPVTATLQAEPTDEAETATVEPTTQPEEPTPDTTSTVESTANPEVSPTVSITPAETTEPISTLTGTVITTPTASSTVEATPTLELTDIPEVTLTLTSPLTPEPTTEVTVTPEVTGTTTVTTPAALRGYPIVPFDSVVVNIPNEAAISSNQTPPQTDVVTNPVIRVVDPLLTKVVNPTQASPGDLVYFTLTLENPSPPSNANATNLVLVDPLPYLVDLVSYNVSSTPPGLVGNVTVVTNIVPIIGHPNGITQSVATTISVSVPLLGPDQRVILDLTTRVNNLASPPPQTIRNLAFLTFNEGSIPPVTVAVDVPLPPSSGAGGHDDNDDDNPVPTLPTTTPTIIPPANQPPAALPPVSALPETGITRPQVGPGMWLLLVIFGLSSLLLFLWWKFKHKGF